MATEATPRVIPGRPKREEAHEYFWRYIALVESDDVVGVLEERLAKSEALIRQLPPDHRYAEGKWTVREVVGHLIDTERIMAYRALRISRGDTTPLPGFDQDLMVNGANFGAIPMEELLEEWHVVREASLLQLRHMTMEMWNRIGESSGSPASARALAYVIAGHELYHQQLFVERYQATL